MTVVALELCNTLSFKLLVSNLQLAVDTARREGLGSLRGHSDLAVVVTLRAAHRTALRVIISRSIIGISDLLIVPICSLSLALEFTELWR